MSGIFGILCREKSKSLLTKELPKMRLWNRMFGMDREELHIEPFIGMGCCYEKVSNKPAPEFLVEKKDGVFAVVDALLYNDKELSAACRVDKQLSDEALLISYVKKFGMDALKDVNGDFSGAFYDIREKTLTLFRDHMGARPLFYYAKDGIVAFSTDIHALLALDAVDSSINEDWIFRTCSGYYVDGLKWTEYQHIFCVRPASSITFSFQDQNVAITEAVYWRLGSRKVRLSSFGEYKEKLKELVTDAVKKRLDAVQGCVGAELSGGLDSGVIDILIHRLGRDCFYRSWSADPGELPYVEKDERLVIADICQQEGISCHFRGLESDWRVNGNIEKRMKAAGLLVDQNEMPELRYAWPPYINTLLLSQTAEFMEQNGASVIFTGHGGDEGVSHRCNILELFYHHEYYHFLKHIWFMSKGKKHRAVYMLKKIRKILLVDRKLFMAAFQDSCGVPELLQKQFAANYNRRNMPALRFAYDPVGYIMDGGSRNRLDNVAMQGAYNGVRYVVPYLDYQVIDFAVSVPRYLYLNGQKNRFLFREAFKDIMPESLYHHKLKVDYSISQIPKKPGWFEVFAKKRGRIVEKLDRSFWSEYLNFDVIDAWLRQTEPGKEGQERDSNLFLCLYNCVMAQNAVEKSKVAVRGPE